MLEIDKIYSTTIHFSKKYSPNTIQYNYNIDAIKYYYKCIKDIHFFNNQTKSFDDVVSRFTFYASMSLHLIIASNIDIVLKTLNNDSINSVNTIKYMRNNLKQPSQYASFEELEDYVYASVS